MASGPVAVRGDVDRDLRGRQRRAEPRARRGLAGGEVDHLAYVLLPDLGHGWVAASWGRRVDRGRTKPSPAQAIPRAGAPDRLPRGVGPSILVEGGSVVNLMAVWKVHGLTRIMRECWDRGVVLAGASAGSLCWHTGGPTDSFGDALAPFHDGLGLLPFSNVHDDFPDQPRRDTYRRLVADGTLGAGYATEDGVGLHYLGTSLKEAVTIRPTSSAWRIEPDGTGGYSESRVEARFI